MSRTETPPPDPVGTTPDATGATSGASGTKPRGPSVFDVAKAAGVSHQTVSRVLNDHPSLRPATRQKVLDAMRELGYRPNLAARALVTSRSRIIGILSTAHGEYGPASSIAAVEAAARARGYSVSIATADGFDPASVNEALEHLLALSVEGLVVVAPQTPVLATLERLPIGVPFVTLQTLSTLDGSTVALDQHHGARLATAHLADLGHTAIAHLAGPADWIDAESRDSGFRAELASRGLRAAAVEAGDWSADSGYEAARALLRPGVTAVFSANDQMALGLLHAAAECGLAVPDDLSVVGFDDTPEARHYRPGLTTVRQNFAEAGRRALARLLGQAEAPPSVEPALVLRGSSAPPPH
ncbi:LacI family DNA-binding transcriptional regulator [Herbiconiux sp.]|uniref:LacI family DNA-binding transcriptional regulator n=1 Tax=Herbiconiux sp. TaxID=1871186 RepID=UPI0025C540A5|nr:LacI family DNA-binding transcriptional regulator [Herbiconiux sp.]